MTAFMDEVRKETDAAAIIGAVHFRQEELNQVVPLWSHERYDEDLVEVTPLIDLLFIRHFYQTLTRSSQWLTHSEDDSNVRETHLLTRAISTRSGVTMEVKHQIIREAQSAAFRITGFDPERMAA